MKKGKLAFFAFVLVVATVFPMSLFGTIAAGNITPRHQVEAKDIGPELRAMPLPEGNHFNLELFQSVRSAMLGYHELGDIVPFFVYDLYPDNPFYPGYPVEIGWYVFKYETTNGEVWVQCDPNTGEYDLLYPDGDPRNDPTWEDGYYYPVVTDEDIVQLATDFEDTIYPTDTSYFGMPDMLDGEYSIFYPYHNGSSKNIILVSNIRDTWYYDFDRPYFTAGFYWSFYEYFIDRNIITMDCHDWANRVGPGGNHPYQYEGLIAHEYQHLIHDDYIWWDDTFMNEGCSMFAEIVCGYGADWDAINSFLYTPDNSLTMWGDQGDYNILADYGQVQLWTTYLVDRFGDDFLSNYMADMIGGIAGLEALFPPPLTFDDVFHDWRIANLIHSGCGKYNYKSIDLGSPEAVPIRVYTLTGGKIPYTRGEDFGTTKTDLGYDTNKYRVGAYGTDYMYFKNLRKLNMLTFDGDDFAAYGWRDTVLGWGTGTGDLLNILLSTEVEVDDPTLTITTYWDIEDFWDYGFIQVSTDGGSTWTSLMNEYTFDVALENPDADPAIIANGYGLTSWSVFFDDDDDGWITMDFDLSAYVGETVLIGFRYMTDLYTSYEGWYISEAWVGDTQLTDFQVSPEYPNVDFDVTLIYEYSFKCRGHQYKFYMIDNVIIWNHETEFVKHYIYSLPWTKIYMLVSPTQTNGESDYGFKVSRVKCRFR